MNIEKRRDRWEIARQIDKGRESKRERKRQQEVKRERE